MGLEAEKCGGVESEENQQCLLARQLPHREAITASTDNAEWNSSASVDRLLLPANKTHQNLGLNVPSVVHVFPYIPMPIFRIAFLPNQCPHFSNRHPTKLGVQCAMCTVSQPLVKCNSELDFQQS